MGRSEPQQRAPHLLLVACDPQWTEAVRAVVAELGGSKVVICDARDALVKLASGDRYSHLLVEDGCTDGLLDELADLTSAHASTPTSMLLLGGEVVPRPRLGVVRSANAGLIRQALTPIPRATAADLPGMNATELRDVLNGKAIQARYQLIVRMADRQPVAMEALARLNHPAYGTLGPDRFVPQLEDAGLGGELTELIAERVFADVAGPWLRGRRLAVALNFPLDVLLRPSALTQLETQRAAAGIPPDKVVVELTESRPVEDVVRLRRSLDQLRSLGYGVSIDDVSPAVPCLEPMLEMPFTCLKLDKALVQRSEHNKEAFDFLQRTAAAAQSHGMTVIAEGVETVTLWDLMLSLGIDEAQGFLVTRPLPVAAVPVWLDAWRAAPAFS